MRAAFSFLLVVSCFLIGCSVVDIVATAGAQGGPTVPGVPQETDLMQVGNLGVNAALLFFLRDISTRLREVESYTSELRGMLKRRGMDARDQDRGAG